MIAPRYDGWDLALMMYVLVGTALSLVSGISLVGVAVIAYLNSDPLNAQAAQWTATGMFTLALTGVPALWLSVQSVIHGQRPEKAKPAAVWLAVALLFPLGLLLGFIAYERGVLTPLLGPVGQVLAVVTPAGLAVILVRRAGPLVSLRRVWGHILLGLWAVPAAALLLEGVALLFAVLGASVGLALTPGGMQLLQELQLLLGSADPEPSLSLMAEITLNPIIIVLLITLLGMMVPIIEEVMKTAAIWPLLRRPLSPEQAYLGGALGGIGFALAEALFLAHPGASWLVTAIARAGATMMHALASGIAGWALAEGVVRRRWTRAAVGIGLAVVLHGLWNVSAIGIGLSQLAATSAEGAPDAVLDRITSASIGIIAVLGLGAAYLLPRLQRIAGRRPRAAGLSEPQPIEAGGGGSA